MTLTPLMLQLIVGILVGSAAGYLGAFMVLRRMSLVGDALSHVALPGIAVALLLQIDPFIGAFAALLVAIVLIWSLEGATTLPSETLVGILFTVSLAIGLLLTPQPDLLEALFGDITRITSTDAILTAVSVLVIGAVMLSISRKLTLELISRDLATVSGISVRTVDFLFLAAVALVVALGLKVAGTVLTGSLVIIPAAAARNIARSLKGYAWCAGAFGALASCAGILAAHAAHLAPGPLVVLASGVIFVASLPFTRAR